jgi:hypothetical protein
VDVGTALAYRDNALRSLQIKEKVCFRRFYLFNATYSFNCLGMKYIAPESIYRIGRIYDDTAFRQAFYDGTDILTLRILWMYR